MMLMQSESPLTIAMKGAVAGVVGTIALTEGMKQAPMVLEKVGMADPKARSNGHQNGRGGGEPTERLADRVSVAVLDRPLEPQTRQEAGQTIHWSYGASWGVFYALVQSTLHLPVLLHGILFGTLVGVVASTVVPAMGVAPPPSKLPMPMNATKFGLHLLYGCTTAVMFKVLSYLR